MCLSINANKDNVLSNRKFCLYRLRQSYKLVIFVGVQDVSTFDIKFESLGARNFRSVNLPNKMKC